MARRNPSALCPSDDEETCSVNQAFEAIPLLKRRAFNEPTRPNRTGCFIRPCFVDFHSDRSN